MKAILVECDPGKSLGGSCMRDVNNVAKFIIDRGLSTARNVVILTTSRVVERINGCEYEDSRNLISVLNNVVLGECERLVILISGHGYSIRDVDGDEIDSRDECINVGFQITDDMIYESLIKKFATRTDIKMLLLSDTCHSGTMFDLPFCIIAGNNTNIKNTKRNDVIKFNALGLSACSDQQLSMCDIGNNAGFGGSLTVALLEYPDIFQKLILGEYDVDLTNISKRLKLLNQTMIISKASII